MKRMILALILFIPCFVYSQSGWDTIQNQRSKWFIGQRKYPVDSIPQDAYVKAIKYRDSLRTIQGYQYPVPDFWITVGPMPAGFFVPVSGRITDVKYDPNNPSIIYLGGAVGGVWKTTNGGVNWLPKTDFLPSLSSGAIAIDKNNTNIIYYGTGEGSDAFVYLYLGAGLFKSTNGGQTWNDGITISGFPKRTKFFELVIKPDNSNIIFAALNSGLYRSTNAGIDWSVVSGTNGLQVTDIAFSQILM
ncbi:MAG: WD40/YVTN/BNR-like repeat-containing protein [Ignavibacteria bacterium]